jgi:hypothetical protein
LSGHVQGEEEHRTDEQPYDQVHKESLTPWELRELFDDW